MSSAGSWAGPLPGTSYSIVARLGGGATGEVFLATHETLGRRVAVKLLRAEYDRDPEVRDRLRAEARLLARISHPALVSVYDLGVTADGRTFFVMEYIEGVTLRAVLDHRGRLPVADACGLTSQVLDGLAVAHANGIVHRDVKPSNILVGPDGRARIVDFGVAKALEDGRSRSVGHVTGDGVVVGTPSYMAPEQVLGGRISASVDLYAAACVFFELVTGSPPFVGAREDVLRKHMTEPPPTMSERSGDVVDAEAESLVARALAKDPGERPRSAEVLAGELRRVQRRVRGESEGTPRSGDDGPVSRGRRLLTSRGNVRELPTTFLGRERELQAMAEWFAAGDRLVTLLGPAGCGKTRLAKRFAALHAAEYAQGGGAWFCDLTEARDASAAVACVSRALGMTFQAGSDETALSQLGRGIASDGPTLVIFDNCEQAAAEIARVVTRCREIAPEARLLVTSRERLGVVGERVYDLAPLPVPDPGAGPGRSEAEQLFVDRARLVRPDYALVDDGEAAVVASIVRALDGIPLAIELAAARMRLMSARTLLARLHKRFELLASAQRETPARQRTLRAAIDWSWEFLEPWEQTALRQCALFRGGFSLDAVEATVDLARVPGAPGVLDVVQRLRDKSLVCAHPSRDFPSELRLGLYESVREYAAERLVESGEEDEVARRHTDYFLGAASQWAVRAERGLVEDVRRLETELENVGATRERALQRGAHAEALRAAIVLDAVLGRSGSLHVRLEMLEQTVAGVGEGAVDPGLLAEVLRRRGVARLRAGAVDGARADAERARELAIAARDVARQGDAQQLRAEIEWWTGGDVAPHVEAARAAARAVGDPAREARAIHTAACACADRKEHERAHDAFLRVVAMSEAAGDKAIAAYARGNLGAVLIQQGRLEEAEAALEESTAALHAMRDTQSYFVHLYNLAAVRQERGDLERAARGHEEVIRAAAKTKHVSVRGMSLAALGALRAARGEIAEAERLLDEAEAASEPAGQRRVAVVRVHRGHLDLALAREAAKRGDATAADERRAAAERRLSEGAQWADTTDDLLTALRWLGRALELESSERYPANAWVIGEDGAWFRQPRGWRIDVGDRQHARAILRALLQARLRSPGRPLATDDVLRAAWPGERLVKRAGTNRVYVTISLLRDLGLRELVVSAEGGYMLDPRQAIAVGAAEDAEASAGASTGSA